MSKTWKKATSLFASANGHEFECCPPLRVGACRDGSPPHNHSLTTQKIVTAPSHSRPLSVRRHNQELSFAPAPRGLLRCIVVVGVLGGTGGWLRPPELALAHCYGYCWRPQQPVRPHGGGREEGGREGYVTAKQNTDTAAR